MQHVHTAAVFVLVAVRRIVAIAIAAAAAIAVMAAGWCAVFVTQFALTTSQAQCQFAHFILALLLQLHLPFGLFDFGQFVGFVWWMQG